MNSGFWLTSILIASVLVSVVSSIDGNWSTWEPWSSCSESCGADGYTVRLRSCDNPPPSPGAATCQGMDVEYKPCYNECVPVNGKWNDWNSWSTCSVTCGHGYHVRLRNCDNPAPAHGGHTCAGSDLATRPCTGTCGATWATWADWSECSASCENGTRSRDRQCDYLPATDEKTAHCEGDMTTETDYCDTYITCPVDGGWTSWMAWSTCDKSCGDDGYQFKLRQCKKPEPQYGGQNCTGDEVEVRPCMNIPLNCPVDGGWTEWGNWSTCSSSCDEGISHRYRTCSEPESKFGGANCIGSSKNTINCTGDADPRNCSVDGAWADWESWSTCSSSCGDGVMKRYRTCSNPAPYLGGMDCMGDVEEVMNCTGDADLDSCTATSIDGGWSDWEEWGSCSSSCGEGTTDRYRTCSNPVPQFGGLDCVGDLDDVANCTGDADADNCTSDGDGDGDGGWSSWGDFSTCSATCGNGFTERARVCLDNRTDSCDGPDTDMRPCSAHSPCPVDGRWSDWTSWSLCSVTCGDGIQDRTRKCNNPSPHHGGQTCDGDTRETLTCSEKSCPAAVF